MTVSRMIESENFNFAQEVHLATEMLNARWVNNHKLLHQICNIVDHTYHGRFGVPRNNNKITHEQHEDFVRLLEEVRNYFRELGTKDQRAKHDLLIGRYSARQGRVEEAIKIYEEIKINYPDFKQVHRVYSALIDSRDHFSKRKMSNTKQKKLKKVNPDNCGEDIHGRIGREMYFRRTRHEKYALYENPQQPDISFFKKGKIFDAMFFNVKNKTPQKQYDSVEKKM